MLPDSDRLAEQLPDEPELLLAACVPEHVKRLLTASEQPDFPWLLQFEAAVATVDIAGFTTLSERLGAAAGGRGAERIQELLNRCFGRLTALVADHGGETVDFAGDALIALWPAGDREPLERATRRAIDFSLRAQRHARTLTAVDDLPITLRAGIGSGDVFAAIVGGIENRWHTVVGGDAVRRSAVAGAAALPTQVVVSQESLALADRSLLGAETRAGLIVERVLDPPERGPLDPLPRLDPDAYKPFVPRAVRQQIEAGVGRWLAELRHQTVLFIELEELDQRASSFVGRFDQAVKTVQTEVYRYGGTVNQVIVDDKGTVALAGWGLATHAHEDDASRAVRCALAITERLAELESPCKLGIATGQAFSGWRGGRSRAQFAMIGATVNRAARLMQAADSVLCDEPTRVAARGVGFSQPRPLSLKGLSEAVSVYVPQPGDVDQDGPRATLVGRERELERISRLLRGSLEQDRGATCIVSAEAGLGKSTLLQAWIERARSEEARILLAKADALERSTPYFAWRQLLAPLLDRDAADARREIEHVLSTLGLPPEQAPLLEPILGLGMHDNEATRSLIGRARADRLRELVARWLAHLASEKPLIVVIEDAHWLDASSWALVETIHAERSALLVLATRPLDDDAGVEAQRLLAQCDERIDLEQLPAEAIETLAARRIGVSKMPPEVARFVGERANGHPFFAEELVRTLLEQKLIEVSHGECALRVPAERLVQLEVSGGMHGIVASRIDRLDVSRQLTLKVASVLGEEIDLETLAAIHPAEPHPDVLTRDLDHMVDRALLLRSDSQPPEYVFRHDITRQVAYELLPFAQRRELNRAVAETLEAHHAAALAEHYSVLAYHWREADEAERTLHYLDRAAVRARSLDAHAEVVRFLSEALKLADDATPAADGDALTDNRWRPALTAATVREARWRSILGQSLSTLGRYQESEVQLRSALSLFREPLPSGALSRRWTIVRQVSRQLVRRVSSRPNRRFTLNESGPLLDVVRTLVALNTIAYHSNDRERMLFALFTSLNLAELCEPTVELVSVYSRACMAAGILGLHRLAGAYVRETQAASAAVGDPSATAEATNLVSIYRLAIGEWQALEVIESSMARAERIGDHTHWTQAAYVCALAYSTLGRFRDSERLSNAIEDRSAARRALLPQIWALRSRAEALLGLGELAPARDCCERALELLKQIGDAASTTAIQVYNLLIVAMHRLGRRRRVWELAELTLDVLERADFVGYDYFSWHHGITEALLDLWHEGYRHADGRDARGLALAACRSFARVDRNLPPGYARSRLCRGIAARLDGSNGRARRHWREALRTAKKFDLRYEEAYARYQIARFGAPDARVQHLRRARDLFADLGDEYHLAQIARLTRDQAPGGAGS